MNKRTIAWVSVVIVLVIAAIKFDLLGILFALIFLGMVPGTNLSVPPVVMMLTYPIAIIGTVYWLARQPLYIGSREKQAKTARAVARKRVAKKTSRKAAASSTRKRYRKTARA